MHNEHAGMPSTDVSGANARVSLLWCPNPSGGNTYRQASQKRATNLKLVQDFGIDSFRSGAPPPHPPAPIDAGAFDRTRSVPMTWNVPEVANPPPAVAGEGALLARGDLGGFLQTESDRLQAATHARTLGQTFLRAGNLRQAKLYLGKAERLMTIQSQHKGDPEAIDELVRSARKDFYP